MFIVELNPKAPHSRKAERTIDRMTNNIDGEAELVSLDPSDIFSMLDLALPGLAGVQERWRAGMPFEALAELRDYYRGKYPCTEQASDPGPGVIEKADQVTQHILQWGPYEPATYKEKMNWEWDPHGDIEWVAAVYRFCWAQPLADAFRWTRKEVYAEAFVALASDWIEQHSLAKRKRAHPDYPHWHGFAWVDIQTGTRSTVLCNVFRTLVHADAFTPEFLGILLASLYDHQLKTERIPMGQVHNKAIFEQRGVVDVAHTFQEFSDSHRWMALALARVEDSLLAQTTTDGVQTEWSFGYHRGVLSFAIEIMDKVCDAGLEVSDAFLSRVRKMYEYIFAVATPDLGGPMFGDASRALKTTDDRSTWPLYATLTRASEILDDPMFAARATLDRTLLPAQSSYAFKEAGTYVLRDTWGPDQICCTVHCPSPGCSAWHDQPDNGTFEFYAYGRWLMPDTGFFTYGHDAEARVWHRQTAVHQTLTLDCQNSAVAGRHRLWHSQPKCDVLVIENDAYPRLMHRRSVWFVEKTFLVILDEAIGDASGDLDLHFQFAPGEIAVDTEENSVRTLFEDSNVLVWAGADAPLSLSTVDGWFAWGYGKRTKRQGVRFRHAGRAPTSFLTVVMPYRGREVPPVSACLSPGSVVGANAVALSATALGSTWQLTRDLAAGVATCQPAVD